MGFSNSKGRWVVRAAWMVLCGGLGIFFILRGEGAVGIGLTAGSAAGGAAELLRIRRQRRILAAGDVLYDERDVQIAGRAAIMTVRVLMGVLSLALLAVVVTDFSWNPPLLPVLGILMGMIYLTYSLGYVIRRRRDSDRPAQRP